MQSASTARRAIAGSAATSLAKARLAAIGSQRHSSRRTMRNASGGIRAEQRDHRRARRHRRRVSRLARHRSPETGRDRRDPRRAAVGYRADRTRPQRHRDPVVPPGLHEISQARSRRRPRPADDLHFRDRRRRRGRGGSDRAQDRGRERAGPFQPRRRRALPRAAVCRRARTSVAGPRHPPRRNGRRCRASSSAARRSASSASAASRRSLRRSRAASA